MGYLLARQLVAAGETVLDVPATLVSRVRVLGTGHSSKSDPNDARSVAVAAFRAPALGVVRRADHDGCGCWRNGTPTSGAIGPGRVPAPRFGAELVPGGIDQGVVVNADAIPPRGSNPRRAALERHRQALELVDDMDRLDAVLKDRSADPRCR